MANMMQFGDFSPLDVLATAASLQSACLDSDSEGENGGQSGEGTSGQEAASEDGAENDGNKKPGKSSENSMVKDTSSHLQLEDGSEGGTDLESSGFVTDLSSPISDTLGSPFSEGEVFTPPTPVTPLSTGQLTRSSGVDKLKPTCVVKLLETNGKVVSGDGKPAVTLKDATKIVLPSKQGPKTMTVLKINKQQVSDHSYAFLCQLQKLKSDEDEGYSSRSSVESEGEGEGHNGVKSKALGLVSPAASGVKSVKDTSPQTVTLSGKKQPKILIVGKDRNLQKIISTTDSKQLLSDLSAGKSSGNIVLRTLLGQKTLINPGSGNGKNCPVSVIKVSSLGENSLSSESPVLSSCEENDKSLTEDNRVNLICSVSEQPEPSPSQVETEVKESDDSLILDGSEFKGHLSSDSNMNEFTEVGVPQKCVKDDTQPKNCIPSDSDDCHTAKPSISVEVTKPQSAEAISLLQNSILEGNGGAFIGTSILGSQLPEESSGAIEDHKPLVSVEGSGDDAEEVTISVTIPRIACGPSVYQVNEDRPEVLETTSNAPQSYKSSSEIVLSDSEEVTISGTISRTACGGSLVCQEIEDRQEVLETTPNSPQSCESSSENVLSDSDESCTNGEKNENKIVALFDTCPKIKNTDGEVIEEVNSEQMDSVLTEEVTESEVCDPSGSLVVCTQAVVERNTQNTVCQLDEPDNEIPCNKEGISGNNDGLEIVNDESNILIAVATEMNHELEKGDTESVLPETQVCSDLMENVKNVSLLEVGKTTHIHTDIPLLGELSVGDKDIPGEAQASVDLPHTETVTEFQEPPCESQLDAILADEKSCAEQNSPLSSHLPEFGSMEDSGEGHIGKSGVVPKNQYIIEDDVPPVTKFSSSDLQDSKVNLVPTDHAVGNTTSAAPVEVMKLLGTQTLSSALAPSTAHNTKLIQKGSNIIHVIPVGGNGAVGPQSSAVGTVQYITRLPGSTAVLPGKLPAALPTTVLVPVAHPQAVKLAAIPRQTVSPALGSLRLIAGSPVAHQVLSPVSRDCVSPSLGTTRSEPCSPFTRFGSPTNSLCSPDLGRRTPEITGRATHLESLENSPGDVINVKITGGQILEESLDETPSKKGPLSIGKVGSLSWKPLEKSSEVVRLDQITGSRSGSGRQRLRIQGCEISSKLPAEDSTMMAESVSSHSSMLDLAEEDSKDTIISDDSPDEINLNHVNYKPQAANRTVHSYVRRNRKASHDQILSGNEPDMSVMRKSALLMSHLHPLIDHDYCTFTEFNAQIQSSIIATTECKAKTERKYTKKSKAARTNVAKSSCTSSGLEKVDRAREPVVKVGRGRPKKRLPEPEPEPDDTPVPSPETPDLIQKQEEVKTRKQTLAEKKAVERSKRVLRDGRHYVKITGSYQDEFVYFATKKTRGRRGNQNDSEQNVPVQPAAVGGLSVFDWYKDLSNSDKNSRFGIPNVGSEGHNQSRRCAETLTSGCLPQTSVRKSSDRTPIHESEVVDLVCELSGFGGSEKGEPASSLITNDQNLGVARMEETGSEKLDLWAEQLSNMLTSMNEDEKQQLFQQLGDSASNNEDDLSGNEKESTVTVGLRDSSFDSYLADFHQESSPGLTQNPGPSQLCDLDDINDSDLIPTEIGNMNAILGDLKSAEARKLETEPPTKAAGGNLNVLLDTSANPHEAFNMKLDKTELFPDMSTPDQPAPAADLAAPELTVVSMYWNDLPGLLINQKEHVRLVDIHKQVLPAKDTGILKKRCQMMGLEILNCSELQRDFLIRYANAAKSKSTVIVGKESAKTLIGFYVDPKPKVTKQVSDEQKDVKEVVETTVETVSEDTLPTMVCEAQPSVEESTSENEPETIEESVEVNTASESSVEVKLEEDVAITPIKLEGGKGKSRKRKSSPTSADLSAPQLPESSVSETQMMRPIPHVLRTPLPPVDLKRSARLKHKKVRYDKMVQGNHYIDENDNEEKLEMSPEPSPLPSEKRSRDRRVIFSKSISKESDDSEISEDHENRGIWDKNELYPEEHEIRKLKAKSRRKRLSNKEKKRLRRLREKVKRKDMRRQVKFHKRHTLKIDSKKIIVKFPPKSKKKLQDTHMYTKKYNQEHCYAACPENFKKEEAVVKDEPLSPEIVIEPIGEQLSVGHSCEVERVITVEEPPKDCSVEIKKRPPLEVVHRDTIHRNAQRGRSQDGELHIQLFKTRDSPCIQCSSCMEFLSLKCFIKHMHHQDNSEDLLEVSLPQKLELRNSMPTKEEQALWDEFQKMQKSYNQEQQPKQKSPIVKAVEIELNQRDQLAKEEASFGETSVSNATRHSTRVRKRKQLHPIEKYVFSKLLPVTETPSKKGKYDPELEFADTRLNELESKLLPSEVKSELERMGKRMGLSVSPIRAVRVKKDPEEDKQVISKYDLRVAGQNEDSSNLTRRQKVLTRRNRNIDGSLTALELEKD